VELAPTSVASGATGSFAWSASDDAVGGNLQELIPLSCGSDYCVALSDRFGKYVASSSVAVDELTTLGSPSLRRRVLGRTRLR
jgi:hypothetical protein